MGSFTDRGWTLDARASTRPGPRRLPRSRAATASRDAFRARRPLSWHICAMKRDIQDQRIALFIDFENLVTRTGFDADKFDLQPALDHLLEKGKVVFRRAYADWTRF